MSNRTGVGGTYETSDGRRWTTDGSFGIVTVEVQFSERTTRSGVVEATALKCGEVERRWKGVEGVEREWSGGAL